jgi:hypothetical protein
VSQYRTSITLNREDHTKLTRLSRLSGQSMSGTIRLAIRVADLLLEHQHEDGTVEINGTPTRFL